MNVVTEAKKLSDEGYGIDEICQHLSLPLALVEEALDYTVDTNAERKIELINLEDLEDVEMHEVHGVLLKSSSFIANQVIKNLNNPEALNALGKASVIISNLGTTTEKLKPKKAENDKNKFSRFLKA